MNPCVTTATASQATPARPVPQRSGPAAGFVDIHCHLLSGLDDGPATDQESVRLAQAAVSGGTAAICATPHASFQYPYDPVGVAESFARLESTLAEDLFLFSGCELEISDESIRAFFDNPLRYTLNRGRYVLVELRMETPLGRLPILLNRFLQSDLRPILAHPERYPFAHERGQPLVEWVEGGGLMQATGCSFSGRMGRRARSTAFRLLDQGLLHFVASDAHDALKRPPDLRGAWNAIEQRHGFDVAHALLIANPLRVLRDEPL